MCLMLWLLIMYFILAFGFYVAKQDGYEFDTELLETIFTPGLFLVFFASEFVWKPFAKEIQDSKK